MKLLILLAFLFASSFSNSRILTIVADEWFPMNGDPNSNTPGYMIELAQAIFSKEGIDVRYAVVPWERAVKRTRQGKYDCVVGAYKSDTPDFVFPNSSWGVDVPMFYTLATDNWSFSGDIQSLHNRKLGVIEGYQYREDFDHYVTSTKSARIQTTSGNNALEMNIKKMMAKRINTLLESATVFNAKIKEMGLTGKFKPSGNIIDPVDMYIACSPKLPSSKTFMNMVDRHMPTLRKTGKLKAILDRYGLKDWL